MQKWRLFCFNLFFVQFTFAIVLCSKQNIDMKSYHQQTKCNMCLKTKTHVFMTSWCFLMPKAIATKMIYGQLQSTIIPHIGSNILASNPIYSKMPTLNVSQNSPSHHHGYFTFWNRQSVNAISFRRNGRTKYKIS